MQVMVLGAGGFIGRHIVADLLAHGHTVLGIARRTDDLAAMFPAGRFVARDLATCVRAEDWVDLVGEVDMVVNAAGLLRGRSMRAIHVAMPAALHEAAKAAGRRVVLISAISARADAATDYAATKLAGEAQLRGSGAAYTILRPSLVYADGSYGGTSLVRGLAALPIAIPLPSDGEFAFTPIHARDLARTVRLVCEDARFAGRTLEPVGPETMSLKQLLGMYRTWLGVGSPRFESIPLWAMRLVARIGDLGGDGPVSTNSLMQMVAGNAGDSAAFADAIGFMPRRLSDALAARPAQVQDRWHARLYFLAPALRVVLVLLWLASAWLGLADGAAETARVVSGLGLPAGCGDPLRLGGSVLDLAIAALVLLDRRARWSTVVQFAAVLGYTTVIGAAVPALWFDPLGPLVKNFPILVAILVHGAIADRR